jgi:amidohydrolase
MDALPVKEDTGYKFASTVTTEMAGRTVNVAHACGHDIHMSVALGTARVLAGMRDALAGTVLFIFQPAEEGPPPGEEGGAPLMLKEGLFKKYKPEAIFGLHSFPDFETGQIGFTSGASMASADRFHIKLTGKQSHGANPHLSVDPVVMASQAVLALQTITSRSLEPKQPAVLTVGIIRGGERFNIIPGAVELEGTVRTFSDEVQDTIEKRMHEILGGIASAAGGQYELEYERINPFMNNDPALSAWSRKSLEKSIGAENVIDSDPRMIAEDFAWFAREIPGFYFRLGVHKPGTETGGLHTPTLRADDAALPTGIRAMTGLVIDYMERSTK